MKKLFSLFGSLIALMMLSVMPAAAQTNDYLQIEGNMTVKVVITGSPDMPDLWYSFDKSEWIQITEEITINKSKSYNWDPTPVCYFKGNNPQGFNKSATDYVSITITGGNPDLKGNVMSLIGGDNFASLTSIPCDYCFYGLFMSNTTCLHNAQELVLPATDLKAHCYECMFKSNKSLFTTPVLPATKMAPWCYAHMFENCINNLKVLPELPALELAEGCYAYMFNLCASLKMDDWYILPAEELAPSCYYQMFGLTMSNGNSTSANKNNGLKYVEIMATSLFDRCGNDIELCCARMFNYMIVNTTNTAYYGRGGLTLRFYWTNWGNGTTAASTATSTAPTCDWFTGLMSSYCTFQYQEGLNITAKASDNTSRTKAHTFPKSSTLQADNYTYLTFDCKTNGGTWEAGCTYNADLRRVVRSDYTAKTIPAAPVKEGESFKGWYTAPTGGTKVDEAAILSQTTPQTYYAQFGEGGDDGGEGGGDNPQDDDDTDLGNIKMTRGTLDFPTYYNSFAIEGENKAVKVRLYFNANLTTSKTDYLSSFDASKSYILPAGGTQRQIASASVAKVEYLGGAYRAAHLVAIVTDTEGNTYNVDIFTNEELNYATYDDVIGTNYNYKVETSWRTCNPFHIYGTQNNEMDRLIYRNPSGRHILYTFHGDYGMNLYYEVLHVQIELFPDASKPGKIPTGIYPINATQEVGTAFIGRCPDDILVYEQNQRQPYCGSFVQYELQATENDYYPNRDVWVLRDGYVEVVNVDEKYWVHVHAYADAHRTTNEECAVIDYTACLDDEGVTYTPVDVTLSAQTEDGAQLDNAATMLLKDATDWTSALPQGEYKFFTGNTLTLNAAKSGYEFSHWLINGSRVDGNNIDYTVASSANEIIAVFTGDGNGGEGGDDPEIPIVSQDAIVNVYQAADNDQMRILYDLSPVTGNDGGIYVPMDMGYGVAWADRNVGASSPSDPGYYFIWGKTEDVSSKGTGYGMYYTAVKNFQPGYILKATEDAATVHIGERWHTPNLNEWIVFGEHTSINGGSFYNKTDDDCSISLPATGFIEQDNYGPNYQLTEYRYYWSSELRELNNPAWFSNAGCFSNQEGEYSATANVAFVYKAMPVRAIYTPTFATCTLTVFTDRHRFDYICEVGQKVTVNVFADSEHGWSFKQWQDNGSTSETRTFVVNKDMSYTAEFEHDGSVEPEEPDEPEIPEMSPDANVTVYQSVTKSTMKILYDLSAKKGKDGLWYTPVDMGYGVAWSDRNVGASSESAIGDYFRWGDPESGMSFSSEHPRNLDVTGYRTYDRLTPVQDAATVNIGSAWRMPDEEDFYQLKTNSVITNNNTFTNKDDNSLYFILPAGGYIGEQGQYDAGYQYYWSRQYSNYGRNDCSGNMGYSNAEHTCFALVRSAIDNNYYVSNWDKDDCMGNEPYLGMPVRAIYVPQFNVCTLTVNVEGYQYVYLCQEGQNVTVTAVANEGYEFDRWTEDGNTEPVRTFTVTGNMTYTATFKQAVQEYNIIYKDKGGAAFSGVHASGYPTVHTYGTATTLASATKEGYNFLGWFLNPDCTGSAVTTLAATAYTSDITLYALWEEVQPEQPEEPDDDELHIILYEDKDADFYIDFSNKYNGKRATTVTYNRQFEQSKWSTLCLPFNVNNALISALKMSSRVYEFKYTKGDEQTGLTLYFAQAKKIEAGKGYIVNANAVLAQIKQFVFPGVVIDTEADINSGFDLTNVTGYNSQGDVYLVGTLRTGLLIGSETGNRYMGLKNNKIYYPNVNEGTNILAYRGIFRSSVDINVQKVRIIVEDAEGEQVSELEVVGSELEETKEVRKYIRNGVLYIERNGRHYTAQGAQVD